MDNEVNCINSKAILDFVKKSNAGDCSGLLGNLDPKIDGLADPENFLRDPNNWISSGVVSKLYERARLSLNDEMAAYKIARHAVENISLGYGQSIIVKAFWSARKALKHAQKINDKWNRTKKIELLRVKRNEGVVRLHWNRRMDVTKDLCLMNQGTYTFLPLIWGGKPLTLKEECCYFEGAPYCEYHLKWPARNRFHEIFSRFYTSKSVLMDTIREMEADKRTIERKYEEVNRLNVALNEKVDQLLAVQKTGKAILSVLDLEQLLTVIMNLLSNVCQINRAIIMLVNHDDGCLSYLHGSSSDGEIPDGVKNYRVPFDRVSNILGRVCSTGQAEYVPDVKASNLRKDNIILVHGNPTSVYVVPLITRSKVIGVFATDAVDGKGIPEETRKTLDIFAPQIAIAIENARLYSKLREQMRELIQSHDLLSRAEKFSFLGNLAARLAHEIKNPMTAIGTFMQMLPRKYDDHEFREEFYQIAMEEITRVNNLITELLDLTKTRESHFERDDLNGLIEKMILLVSPQSRSKQIEVVRRFDSDLGEVRMDSEKMKQVILNLLANAVEFSPQGGRIQVTTRRSGENEPKKRVHMEISDNGVGIPEAIISKVFDPYFTTKHKSHLHSGTGLGLFIAHKNMRDHGGIIDVKSTVNEGTTFTLSMPADSSPDLPEDAENGVCREETIMTPSPAVKTSRKGSFLDGH